MTHKHDGGPAFPRTMWTGSERNAAHRDVPGISMRDYFAAKAMQGYFAGPYTPHRVDADDVAQYCYEMADAMLAQRENENDQ